MDDFLLQLRRSRDAWFMLSWMIFPDNERGSADPDNLLRLADAFEERGAAVSQSERRAFSRARRRRAGKKARGRFTTRRAPHDNDYRHRTCARAPCA